MPRVSPGHSRQDRCQRASTCPVAPLWPFVAPIGLLLMFFSLAVGGGEGLFLNIPIAVTGLLIAAIGAAGWYRDAHREYEQIEAHEHGLRLVAETPGPPVPVVIPEGIHMPGPSPWPFLAPIGLFFVFLGLVLGPLLIVAGAVDGRLLRRSAGTSMPTGSSSRWRPGTHPSR